MVALQAVDIGTLIGRSPGVNGGRLCLAGTGTSVRQVAILHNQGASAEEIRRRYPQLDLARIHAALAYYFANRAAMDSELATELEEHLAALRAAPNPRHAQ